MFWTTTNYNLQCTRNVYRISDIISELHFFYSNHKLPFVFYLKLKQKRLRCLLGQGLQMWPDHARDIIMACAIINNRSKDMRQPEADFNVQEDKLLHIYSWQTTQDSNYLPCRSHSRANATIEQVNGQRRINSGAWWGRECRCDQTGMWSWHTLCNPTQHQQRHAPTWSCIQCARGQGMPTASPKCTEWSYWARVNHSKLFRLNFKYQ